jgi:hypothetical protein
MILPLLPTAHDCRFCGWWMPGSLTPEQACPGHPDPGDTAEETQPNTQKETAQP